MRQGSPSALNVFRILVLVAWAGLVLACLYLVAGVIIGMANPRSIRPWVGVGLLSPGLALGIPWESLAPSQWRSYCLSVGIWSLAATASVLVAIDQTRRILRGRTDETPFTAANARRVRIAGVAVLCSAAAKTFRDFAFASFLVRNVEIPGVQIGYGTDLGLSIAFLGLAVLAVAEVMMHGVRLQEDQDLTV